MILRPARPSGNKDSHRLDRHRGVTSARPDSVREAGPCLHTARPRPICHAVMLPVNAVGKRLEGKPHEPFDGGGWRKCIDFGRRRASPLPYRARPVRRCRAEKRTHGNVSTALRPDPTVRGGHPPSVEPAALVRHLPSDQGPSSRLAGRGRRRRKGHLDRSGRGCVPSVARQPTRPITGGLRPAHAGRRIAEQPSREKPMARTTHRRCTRLSSPSPCPHTGNRQRGTHRGPVHRRRGPRSREPHRIGLTQKSQRANRIKNPTRGEPQDCLL